MPSGMKTHLRHITQHIANLNPGNLAQGLNLPESASPELQQLVAGINQLQTNLLSHMQRQKQQERELAERREQMIQSEKMAALGQLVAGVAHEINTPIGAVKSSGKSIADSLVTVQQNLPKLFQLLDAESAGLFIRLVATSNAAMPPLSSREERAMVRVATAHLEADGVAQARYCADILVQLKAYEELDTYLPLLRHPESRLILGTAYSLGSIHTNSANINIAVDRVAKIVFALKSFSHFDQSAQPIQADLSEGMETVLTIYQNQIKQHTDLVRHYQTIAPILCWPDELNQVWTNLIHNAMQAMQAMEQTGTLTISIARRDDCAVVSIADTGHGIPEAIRERVFDSFFTTKPAGEGTGLGLDIVRKIIVKHRGRIEVESEVGRGTVFHVYLPYGAAQIQKSVNVDSRR